MTFTGGFTGATLNATVDNQGILSSGAAATINGAVTNSGSINPGGHAAVGCLTINGTYVQTGTGNLNIDLASNDGPCTGHDRLAISGAATLDGTLSVALINGFSPSSGTWRIMTFASHGTSTFATENLPPGSIPSYHVDYQLTAIDIVAT
jgi:hypothetical protein